MADTPTAPVHTHRLEGCTPTPLAGYLKALGVLRLLSTPENSATGEAADPTARGFWKNEAFHLQTRLDRESLLRFFLEDYAPSPIVAPWNGRAGFLEGEEGEDEDEALDNAEHLSEPESTSQRKVGSKKKKKPRPKAEAVIAIENSKAARLANIRDTATCMRTNELIGALNSLRVKEKVLKSKVKREASDSAEEAEKEELTQVLKEIKKQKESLLFEIRCSTVDSHLALVDSAYALRETPRAAPILISGGVDGSRDFVVNFPGLLISLLDIETGVAKECARSELSQALLEMVGCLDTRDTMGHFAPGQGGANATTTGWVGSNPLNRWTYILALEGILMLPGAITRRFGKDTQGAASFPFSFEALRSGSGALSAEDKHLPRAELWLPVWEKPALLGEISAVFAEGRLTLGHKPVQTGLDAARAVAALGVSRGIAAFERYSLVQPDANVPYQATPLSRLSVPKAPGRDLIADLDHGGWLASMRKFAAREKTPARFKALFRQLEDALFAMTQEAKKKKATQDALMALGELSQRLGIRHRARGGEGKEKESAIPPPPRLRSAWVWEADDGSPEFRVAAALASLGWPDGTDPDASPGQAKAAPDGDGAPPPHPPDEESDGADEGDDGAAQDDRSPWFRWQKQANRLLPLAGHLAPLNLGSLYAGRRQWYDAKSPPTDKAGTRYPSAEPLAVWGAGGLVRNMVAVLDHRLIEQPMRGLEDKPLAAAAPARLSDVLAFLSGVFDDARCAALLAGLVWARPAHFKADREEPPTPPFAYAALKPLFTPDVTLCAEKILPDKARLPVPPGLIARLRAGQTDAAVRSALARARASGLASPFDPARLGDTKTRFGAGLEGERLAAAVLIPLHPRDLHRLIDVAYAAPADDENTPPPSEETTDAA